MSNQLLASKTVVQEGQPSQIQAPTFNTAVAGFIGIAQKGPVGQAVQCTSFTEFYSVFGGYTSGSYLAIAVAAFFAGGGTTCWVVRTVHYTNIDSAATKTSARSTSTLTTDAIAATAASNTSGNAGPYELANGQTLAVVIDSAGAVTTTITATAAARTAGGSATYALVDGYNLTVKIDGQATPQTVTFLTAQFVNIAAATAAEVAAVLSSTLVGASADVNGGKPRITSDRKGSGSKVKVTGGTANTALAFVTDEVAGTGNVSNVVAVSATEVAAALTSAIGSTATISLVNGAVKITSKTTGSGSHVQVTSASTATAIGFDNAVHTGDASGTLDTLQTQGKYDGTYANSLRPVIAAASSGVAGQFNYTIATTAGVVVETFPNVVIGPANAAEPNYIETVVNDENNGSKWVVVTDLEAATSTVNAVPVVGTGAALTGGMDGISDNGSIGDADYEGSEASLTGLRAFDGVDDLTMLACPDRATQAVHLAMLAYCGTTRSGQVFAILDPPQNGCSTGAAINTYVVTTASLLNITENAAIYWPRWQITNPSRTAFGTGAKITVPLCGHIAGMYARVDGARVGGIYDAPAGPDFGVLYGLLNPDPNTGDAKTGGAQREAVRDLIFPNRINPVWSGTGIPVNLDGARTLKSTGNWPTVAQRRGVSNIERVCKVMMSVFRQKRRDDDLIAAQDRALNTYLGTQCALGAFASKDPKTAFWVDMGKALNPRTTPNITRANIGLATSQPNEFIVLNFFEDSSLGG